MKHPLDSVENEQPAPAGPSALPDASDTGEPLAKRRKTQPAEASTSRLQPVTAAPSRASVHQPPRNKSKRAVGKGKGKGKGKAVANDEHSLPTEDAREAKAKDRASNQKKAEKHEEPSSVVPVKQTKTKEALSTVPSLAQPDNGR